jgi:hypothetical protein
MRNNLVKTLILTTCFSLCSARYTESRVENLESMLTQKMHQLSAIGEQIAQKQKLLESIGHDMQAHLLDRITMLKLEGNEAEQFENITYAGGTRFKKVLEDTFIVLKDTFIMKKSIKGLLINEFFDEKNMIVLMLKNFG